ncbi:MAG TPA: RNA pseudouridine synthase [Lentisphaeria bacterium]|nr:RNA pseudouridine synthase [Lentisphaeria bacterium]
MSSITLEIIYQDNHLLAIDKPAGIPTQDSGSGLDNLEDQARQWVKEAAKKPGNVFLHAVHRLDRPVSGVVLFGRTTKALQRLNLQQREKQTRKVYLALLDRPPPKPSGTLTHCLAHGSHRALVSNKRQPDHKLSTLHYEVIRQHGPFCEVRILLETGRYHQIRAQFAHVGCPIVNDSQYGATRASWPAHRIALHHSELEIIHPTLRSPLVLRSSQPDNPW